jgi:sulfoacetaldehyde dehydrogenase
MSICDVTVATGGMPMVRAAYSSGKPAYGVGAGNSTMLIDETADIVEAARNTRLSKTSDFGSGCSADGNLVVEDSIYDKFLAQLQAEGGYLVTPEQKKLLQAAMWDKEGKRTLNTVARSPATIAKLAGFELPADRTFMIVLAALERSSIRFVNTRHEQNKSSSLLAARRCGCARKHRRRRLMQGQ